MKVVSGLSFVDWCPAVGTCRLLCLWSIMRGNGWRKRGQQWEHREDARGFMCNSCLQNWPLCSMSFVSNFLKNIPFLQRVFMIMPVERCWEITWSTWNKWRHICKCCRSFMKISPGRGGFHRNLFTSVHLVKAPFFIVLYSHNSFFIPSVQL